MQPASHPMVLYQPLAGVSFEGTIHFTQDIFAPANPDLIRTISRNLASRHHRLLIVIERAVARAWPRLVAEARRYVAQHHPRLDLVGEPLLMEGGSAIRNDQAAARRLRMLIDALGMDDQCVVLAIGGGSLLEVVAVATRPAWRLVRIPTTVHAQTSSGVRTRPAAVLNDLRFIETLSRRDTISGLAEAVKIALIRDASFFDWLARHARLLTGCHFETVAALIKWSAHLHADPEGGRSAPIMLERGQLDFGHGMVGALEAVADHELRHGEAVALGIALESVYSAEIGLLDEGALFRILTLLERLGFALWDDALDVTGPDGRRHVLRDLAGCRQRRHDPPGVTLLREIGAGVLVYEMREDDLNNSLDWLRHRYAWRVAGPAA